MALIPKKDNTQGLMEFWPISSGGCVYKVILKVLVKRLKKCLEG